jgi:2-(1,2-epoxy-1,2-dihydrophenyl)acetyl-CoA isomerase
MMEGSMDNSDPVRWDRQGDVAVVTLAQQESRNALSTRVLEGLAGALEGAAREEMRALVLRSDGTVFCSGGDLGGVNEALDRDIDSEIGAMVDRLHRVIRLMRDLPMPTLAAIRGPAVGAGMALALAADVRVLARSATFSTGYIAVGASPDGGTSFHLARSLGCPQAPSSFLLNRRFTADELLNLGLADEMVEDAELDVASMTLAERLAALPMGAVVAMRALVYAAPTHSLDSHLDAEKAQFLRVAHTDSFRRGVAPFARIRESQQAL